LASHVVIRIFRLIDAIESKSKAHLLPRGFHPRPREPAASAAGTTHNLDGSEGPSFAARPLNTREFEEKAYVEFQNVLLDRDITCAV